jgi:uncharacterized protein (DUF433 family)
MVLHVKPDKVPLETKKGIVRVRGSRVTLDTIVRAFRSGAKADDIHRSFPTVGLADIYAVIAYYLRHSDEVDEYLQQGSEAAALIRTENESRWNPAGVRERLLARRQPDGPDDPAGS